MVDGSGIQDAIVAERIALSGRVGLIQLDQLPRQRSGEGIRLDGLKGVVGRADRLVRCQPEHEAMVRHLLGRTWIVESMEVALGLKKLGGAGLRFVTAGRSA